MAGQNNRFFVGHLLSSMEELEETVTSELDSGGIPERVYGLAYFTFVARTCKSFSDLSIQHISVLSLNRTRDTKSQFQRQCFQKSWITTINFS
ncbi:hypothetical protein CDAR_611 [Caerostris darwini]|uniref:Uncharacterized protein n=1 Tax=Caerostris darwini TaxID=1538125 RepID=A0AAV4UC84_9ARAC|nr:hypothetical protein CDAR_611 [Caerostris darwini]